MSTSEASRSDPAYLFSATWYAEHGGMVSAGLSIEKATGQAIEAYRERVMQLPESRVRMEAEALFGYGSAAASLQLLWRYRLLDVLLPQLAERFARAKLPRYLRISTEVFILQDPPRTVTSHIQV